MPASLNISRAEGSTMAGIDKFDLDENDIPYGDGAEPTDMVKSGATRRDALDADSDPFHPPPVPTLVSCLHCGEAYESYLIEWRTEVDQTGRENGFWCCPTPKCSGRGFGFDIFPVDCQWTDENGERMWFDDDAEDDDAETDDWTEAFVDEELEDELMGWDAEDEAQWRVEEDVEDYEIDLQLESGELDDSERPY